MTQEGKANPDLVLLPKLAEYFGVTIYTLFFIKQTENTLMEDSAQVLKKSSNWWDGVEKTQLKATALPNYGFFAPTENAIGLIGDIRGKSVLELACGSGESLVWSSRKGAKELWGLDISASQIERVKKLLKQNDVKAELFVSPMELNPGLPQNHFDLVFSIYGIGWSMDLDKAIIRVAEYLKPGGKFVFSWDNPLMQCIAAKNGKYMLTKSYLEERDIKFSNDVEAIHMHNWKLSTYLNCLASHGFLIEKVVDESVYDEKEAEIFEEGKFYSAGRAKLLNPTFIVKAKKL